MSLRDLCKVAHYNYNYDYIIIIIYVFIYYIIIICSNLNSIHYDDRMYCVIHLWKPRHCMQLSYKDYSIRQQEEVPAKAGF